MFAVSKTDAATVPLIRKDLCTLGMARRVAAMLDLDPDRISSGQALPRGWQFVLLAADTRRSALRDDGFPGPGVPMPDLGLPRLMLGGRTVSFRQDILIDEPLVRRSAVQSVDRKRSPSGPMAVVKVVHELSIGSSGETALVETQAFLLLPARVPGVEAPQPAPGTPVRAAHVKTITPDATLLFQYSALGFNSHLIHLDRDHARDVEGFPDLVVNGGLSTLLLTEFLRLDLQLSPASITVRHLAPLYCNRPVTLAADQSGDRWHLKAFDDQDRVAVTMEVETQ